MSLLGLPSPSQLQDILKSAIDELTSKAATVDAPALSKLLHDALSQVATEDVPAFQAALQNILDTNVVQVRMVTGGFDLAFARKG